MGAHQVARADAARLRGHPPRHRRTGAPRRSFRIAVVAVIAVTATALGFAAYRRSAYEPAPDVAAAGAGYWVSVHGDDDSGTGTPDRPWRSVDQAVKAVPAGSHIFLRDGRYPPFIVDRPGLTVTSAPGERATIVGREGVRDVIRVSAADVSVVDVTVTGCVPKLNPDVNVTGDHGSGIRVDRATGVVIRGVTVRDSHGVNAGGLPVGCYGILATSARDLRITGCDVSHNGAGIVISRGGRNVLVDNNNVHDQDVIIQNTRAPLDDFGGYGLAASFVTDSPGPVFRGNTVQHNIGLSADYGVDGGGVEIYDAANTTITGNTFVDNNGVLETGTGSSGRCANDAFTGNTVAVRGHVKQQPHFTGLVLRCSAAMTISHNTFEGLRNFTFLVSAAGPFAGAVDQLRISDNTVSQAPDAVVFRLQYPSTDSLPALVVDRNRYHLAREGFAVLGPDTQSAAEDLANTVSFSTWRKRTRFDGGSSLQ
jgi:parallel beta-helix repeat protein